MKTAVVILNWNGKKFLEQFLPLVIRNSGSAEVYVADNGSTDDSIIFLQKNFPQVKIIALETNLGFAGGYNAALKKVEADYFVLLNSDVEVTANWIEPVIAKMESDKTIAACQPKIKSFAVRDEFEYAGAAGGFIDSFGYPFCRGRIFDSTEKDNGQYDDLKKIFWATGAAMFVRASAFREVNGFDENFFAHMEEIDLCWRLQLAGHSVWYDPLSTVYHVGGGTLHKSNPHKTYLNFRNNLFMLYKNLNAKLFPHVYFFRLIFDFIAALKFIFGSGGIKEAAAVLRAHRDFHGTKKKLVRSANPSSGNDARFKQTVYSHSILLNYFLKGKRKFSKLKFGE